MRSCRPASEVRAGCCGCPGWQKIRCACGGALSPVAFPAPHHTVLTTWGHEVCRSCRCQQERGCRLWGPWRCCFVAEVPCTAVKLPQSAAYTSRPSCRWSLKHFRHGCALTGNTWTRGLGKAMRRRAVAKSFRVDCERAIDCLIVPSLIFLEFHRDTLRIVAETHLKVPICAAGVSASRGGVQQMCWRAERRPRRLAARWSINGSVVLRVGAVFL